MREQLDHEKLDVYRLELQFVAWATDLIVELCDCPQAQNRRIAEAVDHLDRGGLSILFNTAEGNGKRQMRTRAKFFDDARGSATECAACLDALVAKRACPAQRTEDGKAMLVRIVSMLTKLVDRFSSPDQVREERAAYGYESEEEDQGEPVAAEIEDEGRGTRTRSGRRSSSSASPSCASSSSSYSKKRRKGESKTRSRTRTKDEDEGR